MKILYLSQRFSYETSGIYADLMKQLVKEKHTLTIVSCRSDEDFDYDRVYYENDSQMLYVKVGNQFGANKVKKAIVQMEIPRRMEKAIRKYLWNNDYDLVLYPTPPITFTKVVQICKKHFHARTYLMLKDIFPQNAVDLGMMRENGLIHLYYQHMENSLYSISDRIGCMSQANKEYVTKHYRKEVGEKTEILPNAVNCSQLMQNTKKSFRKRGDVTTFLFGGNMGKPQAITFLLECIKKLSNYNKAKFLLIGSGSEVENIKTYIKKNGCKNVEFHEALPREEFEKLVAESDVGLILLNHSFTIPNYPARTLSYMAKGLPILAATDVVTDIRELVQQSAQCGYWCESDNQERFCSLVRFICEMDGEELVKMGENGKKYLQQHFNIEYAVGILDHFMEEQELE